MVIYLVVYTLCSIFGFWSGKFGFDMGWSLPRTIFTLTIPGAILITSLIPLIRWLTNG